MAGDLTDAATLAAIWRRYDAGGAGALSSGALRLLLEDVSDAHRNHRDVSDADVARALARLDDNGDGVLQEEEFLAYVGEHASLEGLLREWSMK